MKYSKNENTNWAKKIILKLCMMIVASLQFSVIAYAGNDIEILYFGSKDDMAFLGLGQGLEDSTKLHKELGFRLKIESENFRPYTDPVPVVIFAAMRSESIRILSLLNPNIPIFNLIDDAEDVRQRCLPNVFHIMPSEEMRGIAIEEWKENKSNMDEIKALAWHVDYNLGDASNLNKKFKDKRSIELTEQGWAGWVSARIFSEAFINNKNKSSTELIQEIKNKTDFSGHKTASMRFRSDGQLKQSLIIVNGDKALGEYPSIENESLDSLGTNYCL